MSISTRWLDDKHTIIHQTYDTDWTDEEFSTQFHQVEDYIGSVEHEVDLLVELRNVEPDHAPHVSQTDDSFPRKLHSVVVVSDASPMRALLSLVNEITPPVRKSPIVIVDTINAAYEVLRGAAAV